ncbi:MAG: hypothetical protein LW823_10115 [Rickettsiales bacterium]|nr:hypothetical protein [Rickettsiales bacterium]
MVETIVGNAALKAKEDRLLPKLSSYEQHSYVKLREEAIKIERRNPNLDPTANTRFVSEYLDAAVEHRRELDDYRNTAKRNGIIPDPGSIAQLSVQMRQRFIDNYKNNTLPSLERAEPPQLKGHAKAAHAKLMDAMNDETIPEKAVGQFYNKEKGGIQWLGIIGGLVGGLFIFNQMGGFAGGAVGLIATVIATLAGAWLVNKGYEKASNYMNERKSDQLDRENSVARSRGANGQQTQQNLTPKDEPAPDKPQASIQPDRLIEAAGIDPNTTRFASADAGGAPTSDLAPSSTPITREQPSPKGRGAGGSTTPNG